jgi:hypothetical protein
MEYSLEEISEAVLFTHQLRDVIVETEPGLLEEGWKRVNGHTLRKDSPHFKGDEYHVHAELPGGYEATWGVSGKRRHPNKFPAHVPAAIIDAAAKILKVSPDLLETFWVQETDHRKLLIEIKKWA